MGVIGPIKVDFEKADSATVAASISIPTRWEPTVYKITKDPSAENNFSEVAELINEKWDKRDSLDLRSLETLEKVEKFYNACIDKKIEKIRHPGLFGAVKNFFYKLFGWPLPQVSEKRLKHDWKDLIATKTKEIAAKSQVVERKAEMERMEKAVIVAAVNSSKIREMAERHQPEAYDAEEALKKIYEQAQFIEKMEPQWVAFEERVQELETEALGLRNEAARCLIHPGVNPIYLQLQDTVDRIIRLKCRPADISEGNFTIKKAELQEAKTLLEQQGKAWVVCRGEIERAFDEKKKLCAEEIQALEKLTKQFRPNIPPYIEQGLKEAKHSLKEQKNRLAIFKEDEQLPRIRQEIERRQESYPKMKALCSYYSEAERPSEGVVQRWIESEEVDNLAAIKAQDQKGFIYDLHNKYNDYSVEALQELAKNPWVVSIGAKGAVSEQIAIKTGERYATALKTLLGRVTDETYREGLEKQLRLKMGVGKYEDFAAWERDAGVEVNKVNQQIQVQEALEGKRKEYLLCVEQLEEIYQVGTNEKSPALVEAKKRLSEVKAQNVEEIQAQIVPLLHEVNWAACLTNAVEDRALKGLLRAKAMNFAEIAEKASSWIERKNQADGKVRAIKVEWESTKKSYLEEIALKKRTYAGQSDIQSTLAQELLDDLHLRVSTMVFPVKTSLNLREDFDALKREKVTLDATFNRTLNEYVLIQESYDKEKEKALNVISKAKEAEHLAKRIAMPIPADEGIVSKIGRLELLLQPLAKRSLHGIASQKKAMQQEISALNSYLDLFLKQLNKRLVEQLQDEHKKIRTCKEACSYFEDAIIDPPEKKLKSPEERVDELEKLQAINSQAIMIKEYDDQWASYRRQVASAFEAAAPLLVEATRLQECFGKVKDFEVEIKLRTLVDELSKMVEKLKDTRLPEMGQLREAITKKQHQLLEFKDLVAKDEATCREMKALFDSRAQGILKGAQAGIDRTRGLVHCIANINEDDQRKLDDLLKVPLSEWGANKTGQAVDLNNHVEAFNDRVEKVANVSTKVITLTEVEQGILRRLFLRNIENRRLFDATVKVRVKELGEKLENINVGGYVIDRNFPYAKGSHTLGRDLYMTCHDRLEEKQISSLTIKQVLGLVYELDGIAKVATADESRFNAYLVLRQFARRLGDKVPEAVIPKIFGCTRDALPSNIVDPDMIKDLKTADLVAWKDELLKAIKTKEFQKEVSELEAAFTKVSKKETAA